MSAIQAKQQALLQQKPAAKSAAAKIKTWGNHFLYFYSAPDTKQECGLGRDANDIQIMKTNGGFVPVELFNDEIIAPFVTGSWDRILTKQQGTAPQIRALQFYLTHCCKEHSISNSIMSPKNGFTKTQKLLKRIKATDKYRSYEYEAAVIMNYDDFEKITNMFVYDKDGKLDRDLLSDKMLAGIFSECDIRSKNVHNLLESDVTKVNLNEGNKKLPVELGWQIRTCKTNKEKHKKKSSVHIVGCYCVNHIFCDWKCWTGVLELYDATKTADDRNYVQKSGSKKKELAWPGLPYVRRPLPIDGKDFKNGTYYSRNRKAGDKISGVANRIDKVLNLSVHAGNNVDIRNKKRDKFSAHSFRGSSVMKTEIEIGSDPSVTMDTKLTLTNQTTSKLYGSYGGRGLHQKVSAIKIKKRIINKSKPLPLPQLYDVNTSSQTTNNNNNNISTNNTNNAFNDNSAIHGNNMNTCGVQQVTSHAHPSHAHPSHTHPISAIPPPLNNNNNETVHPSHADPSHTHQISAIHPPHNNNMNVEPSQAHPPYTYPPSNNPIADIHSPLHNNNNRTVHRSSNNPIAAIHSPLHNNNNGTMHPFYNNPLHNNSNATHNNSNPSYNNSYSAQNNWHPSYNNANGPIHPAYNNNNNNANGPIHPAYNNNNNNGTVPYNNSHSSPNNSHPAPSYNNSHPSYQSYTGQQQSYNNQHQSYNNPHPSHNNSHSSRNNPHLSHNWHRSYNQHRSYNNSNPSYNNPHPSHNNSYNDSFYNTTQNYPEYSINNYNNYNGALPHYNGHLTQNNSYTPAHSSFTPEMKGFIQDTIQAAVQSHRFKPY